MICSGAQLVHDWCTGVDNWFTDVSALTFLDYGALRVVHETGARLDYWVHTSDSSRRSRSRVVHPKCEGYPCECDISRMAQRHGMSLRMRDASSRPPKRIHSRS